jgi:hypothetical protein
MPQIIDEDEHDQIAARDDDVSVQDHHRPASSRPESTQSTVRGKNWVQGAQPDDRPRHAGLRPDPLIRKREGGSTTDGRSAHQRDAARYSDEQASNAPGVLTIWPRGKRDRPANATMTFMEIPFLLGCEVQQQLHLWPSPRSGVCKRQAASQGPGTQRDLRGRQRAKIALPLWVEAA